MQSLSYENVIAKYPAIWSYTPEKNWLHEHAVISR